VTSSELADLRGKTVRGTFFESPSPTVVTCLKDALITVDDAGTITAVIAAEAPAYEQTRRAAERAGTLVSLPGVVLPGFVDTHIHAPQYPQVGKALDVPLEVWLQRYTFALEARYHDLDFAQRSYSALVSDLLASGTTTALYFGTIHVGANKRLADICFAQRQRAFIGKVAMDDADACPAFYRDSCAAAAIDETRELIAYISGLDATGEIIAPVITPRFTPACTRALLAGLGELAHHTGCRVQTHCSESDWQHGHAQARFGMSDLAALDSFALIGRRSVLAHGNFLSDDDMSQIALRGASVAHCPYSNFYFANAVFPLRVALAKGLRVGLGTDVSGGPSASMFESIRMALVAARVLEAGVDPARAADQRGRPHSRIETGTAFYLATAGGGDALDLRVGRFAPGYFFDAMLIDANAAGGTIRLWDEADDDLILQTILLTASRPNVAAVWTGGVRAGSPSAVDR
jgi:guanine deaminase